MDSSHLETIQKDIEEIENFISNSKRPNITRILKEQKILLDSSLKSEKNKQEEMDKSKENNNIKDNKNKAEKSNVNYTTINKYSFENSDKYSKVYFTEFTNLKSHDQSKITTEFRSNGFTVCIHDFNGKNFRFNVNNLNKQILPEESYFKSTSSGLIVYLKKEKNEFWDTLEKKKGMLGEDSEKSSKGFDKEDPSLGLMNMMKEMYQNGDDNTKRMIAESWSKAQSGKGMDMPGMGGMPGMEGMPDMSKMDFSKFKDNN